MRKMTVPGLCKTTLLVIVSLLLSLTRLQAQFDIQIGNGTTSNGAFGSYPCPLQDNAEASRMQFLYRASELQAMGMTAGEIRAFRFTVTNVNGAGKMENVVFKIGGTTATALVNTAWENFIGTPVVTAPVDYQPVNGINSFNLPTPFIWNGTDNILLEVCNGDPASLSSIVTTNTINPQITMTTLTFNGSHNFYGNNLRTDTVCTTRSTINAQAPRPNIIFQWVPAATCDATLDPASVTSSVTPPAQLCASQPVTLTWTGNVTYGLTMQWQSSPDDATWTDILGANSKTYTGYQLKNTYYRMKVTCPTGSTTKYSTSTIVNSSPLVPTRTYFIDNSLAADDPANFKYKNIKTALPLIACGIDGAVTFDFKNTGTKYIIDSIVLNWIPGTSATNTITFKGNGSTLLYTGNANQSRGAFRLNDADYVTIDGFVIEINSTSSYGWGVQLLRNADNNTVKNCEIILPLAASFLNFTQDNFIGIVVNATNNTIYSPSENTLCDNNTFDNNKISGGAIGISIQGNQVSGILNNRITRNTIKNYGRTGILVGGTTNTLIEGNDLTRPDNVKSSDASNIPVIQGIAVATFNARLNISRNNIHDVFTGDVDAINEFQGIGFKNAGGLPGDNNIVSNNIIWDIKGNGPIYGIYNSASEAVSYYHNTISLDNAAAYTLKPTYGYYRTGTAAAADVYFKNNQVSILRGGGGLKYGAYLETSIAGDSLNYNNYYIPTLPSNAIGFYNGTSYTTLAGWRAATKNEANSLSVDPIYTNATAGDFKPLSNTLNDKGTNVGISTDYTGVTTRSTSVPDIGAYEFALAGCLTNFSPGVAYSSVGAGTCLDKPVTLNLKNNDVGLGLTYKWQTASAAGGPWTDITGNQADPAYTFKMGPSGTYYYRAVLSCNGGTPVYSNTVTIVSGGSLASGTYTIDNTLTMSDPAARMFASFTDAVSYLSCGIAGPVVFNVKAGVYAEKIRINNIPGTSSVNTITFQSIDNNPATAELKYYSIGGQEFNYVVQLDSARYINFKALTLTATNNTKGRVFDIANSTSNVSIINCVINAPIPVKLPVGSEDVSSNTAGIYAANNFTGGQLLIKGNTINNGAKGIYLRGPAFTVFTNKNVIDSNYFVGTYHTGIHAGNASNITISRNIIPMDNAYTASTMGNTTSGYEYATQGINMYNCDSASQLIGNQVTMSNIGKYVIGIAVTNQDATAAARSKVMNNKVVAVTGLTAGSFTVQWGMVIDQCLNMDVINNVISISSANAGTSNAGNSVALRSKDAFNVNYYNNSLLNTSVGSGSPSIYNVALHITQISSWNPGLKGTMEFKNNIIVNKPTTGTNGAAILFEGSSGYQFIKSDYNLLYSSGTNLLSGAGGGTFPYTSLAAWRAAFGHDQNSIVIDPAFISTTDLRPDVANPNSWAMQGRGVQLAGNNADFDGNARATSLTAGVPDLGAYEFHPTVEPPYLTAIPAAPAAGVTQAFVLGTDTVARIAWAPGTTVPTDIKLKRYSGVLPAGLAPTEKSMYYYVSSEVTGSGSFTYDVQHTFYDSWLRNLPTKSTIKLGRTDAAGTWAASANSTVDSISNIMKETALTFADKFTGMTDGLAAARPAYVTTTDSSNKGTRFWVPYGLDRQFFPDNSQQLKIIVVTEKATQVTVKVNGTGYSKTYNVGADTAFATDEIPKAGAFDARLTSEGWFKTGVSIESTEPITAYIANNKYTGALLLPTGTYSTAYQALSYRQHSQANNYGQSWVNVVADNDNTVVEITPSAPTEGGRTAGVPFRVTLQRGEVYQVLGALKKMWLGSEIGQAAQSYEGYELSGTTVVSVPNSDGKCLPIGVFSGSSATTVTCDESNHRTSLDVYFFQQNLPEQAWGKYYLTAPVPTRNNNSEFYYHVYRVMVKDPATVVKRNGAVLTNKVNNWYEFSSNQPEYIEADKPVLVAQYNAATNSCINDTYASTGMAESINYLTPLGHGVKKAKIFRKQAVASFSNFLVVIIPNEGLSSLKIDGSATVDNVYAHPNKAGYSVVLKKWTPPATNVYVDATIESDTTFTAMAYNPGAGNNIYTINAAMEIPRVEIDDQGIKNVHNLTTPTNAYTCAKTPFKPTIMLPVTAKTITWKLSQATGMTPSTNITETNPVPVKKVEINFQDYYVYTLDQSISFDNVGTYSIPVSATYSFDANTCDKTVDGQMNVTVIDAPAVDYTTTYTGCIDATASFAGTGSTSNGVALDRWNWSFGDNTTANTQNATKKYNAPGTFNVALQAIATDGCVGNVKKDVVVNALPTVTLVKDSLAICTGTNATLAISNPATNATYSWYDQPTGGTATATGVTYTNSYTAKKYFYVGAVLNGCSSVGRTKAVVSIKPTITAPTVAVDNVGINSVRFTWEGVANANGYEVSTDGGATWTTPSSGSTGLSHTINGLRSFQTVALQVRSIGDCNTVKSNVASATTLSDKVYVPNTFTPNGDGLNDQLQVYVTGAKEVQLMVFNQWGQKVFESNTVSKGWDGTVKGKKQPSGVYLYTCKVVLANGDVIEKNGSVNLIR